GLHARLEFGAVLELDPDRLACARGELADPELHAAQVAAAAQEGVVQVAHVLRVRPGARGVFAAGRVRARDRLGLVGDGGLALALRATEAPDPEGEAAVVGQARQEP